MEAKDVGITEYRTGSEINFTAVIKSRFSDFIVNEVAENDEVVHLDDLSVPEFPSQPKSQNDSEQNVVLSEAEEAKFLEQLAEFARSEGTSTSNSLELSVGNDKLKRKAVHELVRANHDGKLISETRDDDSSVIRVTKVVKGQAQRGSRGYRSDAWPRTAPNYCQFAMYKQNRDTIEAIEAIAQRLHIAPRRFSFAGTKDRHAKTTQLVTAYRVRADDLARCVNENSNRQMRGRRTADDSACKLSEASVNDGVRGVKVGNFRYVSRALHLGALHGNRFCVALRDVRVLNEQQADDADGNRLDMRVALEKRLAQLAQQGFLNYFGTQRFGTRSQPTWRVGRCLLQRNWSAAVETILQHSETLKRKLQEQEGAQASETAAELHKLVDRNTVDSQLRRAVDRFGNTLQAIQSLPRTMRTLYVHAYQSVLWNNVVSRRLREFGSELLDGDLVRVRGAKHRESESESEAAEKQQDEEEPECEERNKVEFEVIKKGVNDASYSIFDVLIPLVGFEVTMPNNVIRDWYVQMLVDDGLVSDSQPQEAFAALRSNVRDFSLPGAYRHMCVRPADVEFEWTQFRLSTDQLSDADWDLLVKKYAAENNASQSEAAATQPETPGDAKCALLLKFTLPCSSYATVALRELLHSDV